MYNLHQLPKEINAFSVTSKSDPSTMAFFGELNPLSNFHRATFNLNNHTYHSSEQVIQHTKAEFFRDEETAKKVMNASTSLECKRLLREIANFNSKEWEKVA